MRLIFLLATCALLAAPVVARPPRRNVDALKTMNGFGTCVGRHQADAIRFMNTVPESPEELKQALRISTSSCLSNGELRFRPSLLRGAVAEVLFKSHEGTPRRSTAQAAFVAPSAEALSAATVGQRAAVALVLFGQCVASRDTPGVTALLHTPVESSAERSAFKALDDAMTRCSTVNFKIDRFQMRGYLAEGAYRNAVAGEPDSPAARDRVGSPAGGSVKAPGRS